ncbi:MAG TPA: 3-oxoacyl-ACP reductase [Thermoleophilaceae bacterium]|nr:3-oxoacyl-ACP reductase [Thermoleophilaceae bacterium]
MNDRYHRIANSGLGGRVVKTIGLPQPTEIERHEPGKPVVDGPVLLGAAEGGRLTAPLQEALRRIGAHVVSESEPEGEDEGPRYAALVYDATGIETSARLRALYDFFHPVIRSVAPSGRVIVLTTPPESCGSFAAATAQRAVEGFVRSVGKEVGRGATANLVEVEPGADGALDSTLRFLLSARSAYVSGQGVRVHPAEPPAPEDWDKPHAGRVAVVTGAARGIGAAIAEVLARDGAEVIVADIPAAGEALTDVANRIGGEALQLDITDSDASERLAAHVRARHGGLHVLVHNAGITKDKTLGRMSEDQWDAVLGVNLVSQERINERLLGGDALRENAAIVSVSSVSGIAGNRGQTNYATSKAGIIGMVRSLAADMRARGATINAVAPGFIETDMTAAMPFATREAGRRMNSLAQGGQPVDVAETIAWLAAAASSGVNGNVVRVCGQSLLGA